MPGPSAALSSRPARRITGFGISLVLHILVLLLLALLITRVDEPSRVRPIEISFATAEPAPVPELVAMPVEMAIPDPEAVAAPAEADIAAIPELPPVQEPEPPPDQPPVQMAAEDDNAATPPAVEPMPPQDPPQVAANEPEPPPPPVALPRSDAVAAPLEDGPPLGPFARPAGPASSGRTGPPRTNAGILPVGSGGDEIGRRLARAGAQTGDIQVSLAWNNVNDLDLHVITPGGERIYFGDRVSICRGMLDVDMNAGLFFRVDPVENIFWPPRSAPPGMYQVMVHHYAMHCMIDPTPFHVRIVVAGKTVLLKGVVSQGQLVPVARFTRDGDGLPDEEPAVP
jgi:hypothetical protein